ncbi:MAG: 16S rRNA (adenine(1518)-N(6)/adenine(1519)-N(6))-dimethyltransferase RsmA [Acidimicrobiia bacterium]|nr:16S rRNA (adenine(1518)-N(6)/adenine(1519)-N(6))-dimethyltransferase RsmA [Acidimicrobiia bacterium]
MALTPSTIPALLARHGLAPSRALGQNFLADPNTAARIARLAEIEPGDRVLEIGPGVGSLTVALLAAGAKVTALELDRHVIPALEETVGAGAVRVVVGDALRVDLDEVLGIGGPDASPVKMVSNLPYNVATPIVMRVLESAPVITSMLVMVQREVGERMAAGPGSKIYGAVSVKIAYFGRAELVGFVPPSVFIPAPKVESALVRIRRAPVPPVAVPSASRLFELVRAGFGQRRKMLRGALKAELGARVESVLAAADIDGRARAETLGLDQWAAIARADADQNE